MTPDPKFHKCTTNLDNHGKFSPLDNGETIERPLYECCNNKDTILEFQDKLFFEIMWILSYHYCDLSRFFDSDVSKNEYGQTMDCRSYNK